MSFIIQEIPAPTVFRVGKVETAQAASGTVNFYVGEQDILIYNQTASQNWNLNITYDPTTSLDVAMGSGDVASVTFGAKIGSVAYAQQYITIDGTASGINFSYDTAAPYVGTTSSTNFYDVEILKQTDLGPFYVTVSKNVSGFFAANATVPNQVTNVSATATGASGATVTYASGITESSLYPVIDYKISSSTGITLSTAGTSIDFTGLTTNVPVTFKVAARNALGYGPESNSSNSVTPFTPAGQEAYTTPGTYSWVAPAGVTSVSVVAVGAGAKANWGPASGGNGHAGGGGGLGYKNNISVTPGDSYTVFVGNTNTTQPGGSGEPSYFISSVTVQGGGGAITSGGTYVGDGGGNGGNGQAAASGGGGGAGGYSGNGGNFNSNGSGGGGGGGIASESNPAFGGSGGGGVGLLGQGTSGTAGAATNGGSGGSNGSLGSSGFDVNRGGSGGAYGGGGGGNGGFGIGGFGGVGAVRIIWAGGSGITRAFPSTNTGDL
jgi:hypothetical protein